MAAPTSTNEVTARKFSSSISAFWTKIKSTFQTLGNLVTAWGSTPSDTKYPSEKLVKTSLDGKANVADAELSTTSTNPLQNKEITRWHNIIIGDDGFVSGSAANPQLSLQKLKLGALSHYNKGVNIKIYTYDEGDEGNASLVFDIDNASDSVKDNFYNGLSMDTLFQSEAGKYVKIVYTGSTSCYFRALGVFMDTKDTSSTVSLFYGHLRVSNVDYPESGQFSTWGSLVIAAFSKTSATVAELILRPKTSASKCRIFGFRCLNTYTGSDWAVLIGRATSALKLTNSRKLCVDLSRTADSTFDGSADQTNIPVKNTLPVARGGTGKTSVTAGNYLVGNGTSALQEHTPNAAANNMLSALPDWTANPTDGVKLIRRDNGGSASFGQVTFLTVWNYIKDKISSVLGLTATAFGGNAATATALSAGADRTKLDGIAAGAEVNVQSDWNQATTTADDYIKNKPTIPSGTQLVYDCGTGSTSTTDFDNALAAFNAGNWVIIHSSGNTYHCVGTYNSGLRFKQIANETASIKVNTLNWTRGSAPSVGTQLEPSMPGHTHSQYVEKAGDTMSGNLTISKGANQGDTKFVASRTDTGTTGWFGVGDGGKNHGVYSESAYANTNNDVDKYTKGWIVRTDENGYSSLVGKVDGLFSKSFGDSDTLMGMKRCLLGYSFDLKDTYTHVSATAIIEARLYSAGVSGGSITMLFNASARGDVGSYYRLQVISYNNWNVNNVCPVLIVQQSSATAKRIYLGLVSGGPASTTLRTFSFSEIKVLPINGTAEFTWEFGWDTNDFNSNTMTMIKPYVYPRAQIGTAIGSSSSPLYVKNDGDFATANLIDRAVGVKDAGRADAPASSDATVKLGWSNSAVPACTPDGTSTYSAGQTVGTTKHLVTVYEYNGVAYYKDVQAANVKVGDSVKWGGYKIQVGSVGSDSSTIYFT